MRPTARLAIAAAAVAVVAASAVAAFGATASHHRKASAAAKKVHFHLTPSSPALAACMPHVHIDVDLKLTTNQSGFDVFSIHARGLPPRRAFTTFLIEQTAAPFGAAEYIGDFTSDRHGNAHSEFRLIVEEAFSSTLVNGQRVRVDLNRVGAWFADPTGDDFCLGKNSPVTPFDGDNKAGVQAFNSAKSKPLPAP